MKILTSLPRIATAVALLLAPVGGQALAQSAAGTNAGVDLSRVTVVVGTAGPRFQASWDFSHPDVPYTVKFVAFDGSAPIVEALTAGAVDIGMPGDIGVIFAHAAGAEVDIVGTLKGNPDFLRLIVPRDSSVRSLGDLKGKTIAVAKGTSSHLFILKAINAAGFKTSDFKWAFLSNPDAGTAFQQGNVDAWATWDPFAATAEIKWGAKLIEHATANTSGWAYWVARPKFFADNSPKAIAARDFIARYVAVSKNEVVQRDKWTGVLAAALKLDPAVAKQVAEHYYFTSNVLDQSAEDDYGKTAKLLLDQGLIRSTPDPAKHFDYKSVNAAVSAAIAARDK